MKPALERNGGLFDEQDEPRDLVLGAPALLGIVLAVGLVCAVCFGFGYSQGHGWRGLGTRVAATVAPPNPKNVSLAAAPPQKPAPGVILSAPEETRADSHVAPLPVRRERVSDDAPAPESVRSEAAPPRSGTLMVQIAAVSRSADAATLAGALRHNGFAAVVRTSPADSLFHVQVGPFATLAAAKATRARLADSGYNAFVKP